MLFPIRARAFGVLCIFALLTLVFPNAAWSMGKNGGGALYLHFDDTIHFIPSDVPPNTYFDQFEDACPAIDPMQCQQAYLYDCHYGADLDPDLNPLFPTPRYIKWVCAVFPETTCVEIAEVYFEIGEITGNVDMFAWGTYHFEAGGAGQVIAIPGGTGAFPSDTGSGVTLLFDPPLTSHVVPLCYIAGYPEPNGTTALGGEIYFKDGEGNITAHIYDPDCPYATAYWLVPGGGGCNPSLGDDPYMHACCLDEGDLGCMMMSEEDCMLSEGVFLADYDTCEPNPCNEGPFAACCYENPQYPQGILACEVVNAIECEYMGGIFHNEWESCDPNLCNGPVAACCYHSDELSCAVVSEIECEYEGGEWLAGTASCDPDPCNNGPFAACCIDTGSFDTCQILNEIECEVENGDWHPEWETCDPNPCNGDLGACCYYDDDYLDCEVMGLPQCDAFGGLWLEGYESCDPDPCNVGNERACCYGDDACVVTTSNECDYLGGTWLEQWDFCEPDPCGAPLGACCYEVVPADRECAIMEEVECGELAEGYWLENQSCDPNPCLDGVCCLGEQCTIAVMAECADIGGTWFADLTSCEPEPCNLRACCDQTTEECTITWAMDCEGEWLPEEAACDPNPCWGPYGPRKTCCIGPNCTIVTEIECISSGGIWDAGLNTCRPINPCTTTLVRACCIGEVCELRTMEQCENSSGEWLSYGETCEPNPCSTIVTGSRACCLPNGACMLLEELACNSAGGDWVPEVTTCTGGDLGNPCRLRVCCDGLTPMTTLMRRDECAAAGGDWLPDVGYFDPNPCDPGSPVQSTSWGKIKALYKPAK